MRNSRLLDNKLLLVSWWPLFPVCPSLPPSFSAFSLPQPALWSPHSLHRTIMAFWVQYVLRLLSFLKIETSEFAFRSCNINLVSEATTTYPEPNRPHDKNVVHSVYHHAHAATTTCVPAAHQSALQGKCLQSIPRWPSALQRCESLCLGLNFFLVSKMNLTTKFYLIYSPHWDMTKQTYVSVTEYTLKGNLL